MTSAPCRPSGIASTTPGASNVNRNTDVGIQAKEAYSFKNWRRILVLLHILPFYQPKRKLEVLKGFQKLDRREFLLAALAMSTAAKATTSPALPIGRLLISGFRGTEPGEGDVDVVRRMLEAGACAGVLLLRRNCRSPEQLSRLTSALRGAAGAMTPVISIDQEGGKVARLDSDSGFLNWHSAAEMAQIGYSDSELLDYWTRRAQQMLEAGINLNFAPVVDLNLSPENPIIGGLGRSFGIDPERVTRFARIFIQAHRAVGIKTSLKHFPGHGSSTADSHRDTADVSLTWKPVELTPFESLARSGLADSVMNAHLLHPDFSDAPTVPASLSRRSVDAIRTKLGFDGAIFTDDMQMVAVEHAMPFDSAAIAAVAAGNTFLIYSNYRKSDGIETVERALAALNGNFALLNITAVEKQIADADAFRSELS